MMNKTQKRAEWIADYKAEIEQARKPVKLNPNGGHNAYYCKGMSGGGWGWWVRAFRLVGVDCQNMPYWSGKNPTPSTAINEGIAKYILREAPIELLSPTRVRLLTK
jgi:ABC-type Fe3+-hydroxamate transport system substrate-binding protein